MKQHILATLLAGGLVNVGLVQAAEVQVWGVVDGFVQVIDNGVSTQGTVGTNGRRGTKFGLRGTENLAAGNQVFFELESGIRLDDGRNNGPLAGQIFDGQALVGLRGAWGQLSVGRQYTPHWGAIALVDPTEMSMGSAINYFGVPFGNGALTNRSNSVLYMSAPVNGFMLAAMASLGEKAPRFENNFGWDEKEENLYNIAVSYWKGPAFFNLSYLQQETNEKYGNVDRYYVVSGSYDFGAIKPSVIYVKRSGSKFNDAPEVSAPFVMDADTYQLGATVPAFGGSFLLTAGVIRTGAADMDASAWGVKYEYPLSKRTIVYGGLTGLNNDGQAAYVISPGGPSLGIATPAGAASKSAYLGMSHSF